jgi:hypothetical protein
MKTCRHCLSEDLPDAATHCRHCGKRQRPSHAPAIIGLMIFVVLTVWAIWAFGVAPYLAHQEALLEAHEIINKVNLWCSDETASDLVDVFEFRDRAKLEKLDLGEDRLTMAVALGNRMEQLGCGPAAQLQRWDRAQAERAQKEKEARKAWAHRNGAVWITSFPPGSTLIIDGRLVGETPISLTPSPGHHILRAVLLGYKSVDDSFEVIPGQEKSIAIDMGDKIQ